MQELQGTRHEESNGAGAKAVFEVQGLAEIGRAHV